MKKALKVLALPLLTLSLFAAACSNTGNNKGNSSEAVTSKFEIESVEPVSTTEIEKGSIGGYLIDIATGSYLEVGCTFKCSYSTSLSDKTVTIKSSKTDVMEIKVIDQTNFNIVTKAPGDAILTIYDADGIVSYNKIIHVRTPYTPEEVMNAVAYYDVYTSSGIYGNYRFVVTDVNKYFTTAVISGAEKTATSDGKSEFDMEYEEVAEGGTFEGHFYRFTCSVNNSQDEDYLGDDIKEVYISKCADRILVYYALSKTDTNYSLFELFTPQSFTEGN